MPISRAPPPLAEAGTPPTRPRSMMFDACCVPVVGASVVRVEVIPAEAPLMVPVKVRSASWIMLVHHCFVVKDGVDRADDNAAEGRDDHTVELFEAEQDVGLVHGLEIEVRAHDAVAVDSDPAHVGADFGGIRGLD